MPEYQKRDLRLLADLEALYPGVKQRCLERADAAVDEDGSEDDGGSEREPARLLLRRADAVPELFEYQRDLVNQFESLCLSPPPDNIGLLTLPTGAGKTRTAAVALLRALAAGRTRSVLWLAPSRELLEQAAATLRAMWLADRTAVDMELIRADLLPGFPENLTCGVVLATPQMVVARLRRELGPDPDVVVFDEAHHVEAPVFRRAVERLRARRQAAVIGLSATPGRTKESETERLVDFFNGRLLRSRHLRPDPMAVLRQRGVLAKLAFKDIPVSGRLGVGGGGKLIGGASRDIDRFRAIVRLAAKLSKTGRVLVFTRSVDYATLLVACLSLERVAAADVSSRDSMDGRMRKLRDFERGAISVIANKQLLATGYDCPGIRHVVLGTQIRSAIMFEQIVGRASRGPMVGGHARSTVWQFEDHLAAHGMPQSYYRYSDYDWRGV